METENKDKRFKAYHGDMPSDVIERMEEALASYGLKVVNKGKSDWYVEYEIEVIK